jgi:metallo-beta-lactamase family protein
LVDCGLFQGLKELRLRNWAPFPVDPASIDAVVLTHAHLDHTGYLPALAKGGFKGPIFATAGTHALCGIVLPDSGRLQEEDAFYANRKGFSKHAPALPLYTEADADRVLERFTRVAFEQAVDAAKGVRATFRHAGHILGSASVVLELDHANQRTLLFSGDLGRPNHPLLRPPAPLPRADVVLVESTYGDRRHEDIISLQRFEEALVRTASRGGMTVIPSFAVDRTEVILFHLRQLIQAGRVPELPVYLDSPMALATLNAYRRVLAEGGPEFKPELQGQTDPFDPGQLIEVQTVEQSKKVHAQRIPSIIIAASGMATGGRVLHHLAHRLPDHRNTVILVGYQSEGTRGRALLEGARAVKMLGRYVPVRAEVVNVPAFSVHADQAEIIDWLRTAPEPPAITYVVHGEKTAADALRGAIEKQLDWTAAVPRHLEQVRLD